MKVIQLITGKEGAGVLAVLEILARELPGVGWIALESGRAVDRLKQMGVSLHVLGKSMGVQSISQNTIQGCVHYFRRFPQIWTVARAVCETLSPNEAYLLHCHSLPVMLLASLVAMLRKPETKIIYHFHSTMNQRRLMGLMPSIQRQVLVRRCDQIIAVSQAVAEYWRGAPVRVSVLYNGVYERNSPSYAPTCLAEFAPETRHIICAGRLDAEKGHHVAIEALALVRQTHPCPLHLWIAGGPFDLQTNDYVRLLVERTRILRLEQQVTFLGHVGNLRDWHPYMRVGLALRVTPEPCSMWVLETMFDGLPLVATATGGTPELVRPEKEGLLVRPNDPRMVANAIIRLLSEPSLWMRMRKNCQSRARACFSVDQFISNLVSLYIRVAGGEQGIVLSGRTNSL